jgi:hypothetical protein
MATRVYPSLPQKTDQEVIVSFQAARRRFQNAFPELAVFFPWLSAGTDEGVDWQGLLGTYIKRVGTRRTGLLASEVQDLLALDYVSESDFEHLSCDLLGLARSCLAREELSSKAFVGMLGDQFTAFAPGT